MSFTKHKKKGAKMVSWGTPVATVDKLLLVPVVNAQTPLTPLRIGNHLLLIIYVAK